MYNITYLTLLLVALCTFLIATQSRPVRRGLNSTELSSSVPDVTKEGVVGQGGAPILNVTTTHAPVERINTAEVYTDFGGFLVSNASLEGLQGIIQLDPAFVYTTLNFINEDFDTETAYLNDTQNVVDPLTWTWVKEGKGFFLRSLPPNFLYLSLGSLQPDVYETSIDVVTDESAGVFNVDDSVKLQRLSEFLNSVFSHAYKANNQTQSEFRVCQEFFSGRTDVATTLSLLLSLHVYMYMPSSLQVTCWSSIDNVPYTQMQDSVSYLAILNYIAVLVGALYVPIIISSFLIRHHQPREVKHYDKASSPPVGFKYFLLHWGNKYKWIYVIRIITFISILLVAYYAQDFILRMGDDRYRVRMNSVYRSVVDFKVYVTVTVLLSLTFLIYIARLVYTFIKFKSRKGTDDLFFDKMLEDETHRKRVFFLIFEDDAVIPEPPKHWPWSNKFHHYMKHRMLMPFDYHTYMWKNSPDGECVNTLKFFRYLIRVPITIVFSISVILFYCPTFYILQRFWVPTDEKEVPTDKKDEKDEKDEKYKKEVPTDKKDEKESQDDIEGRENQDATNDYTRHWFRRGAMCAAPVLVLFTALLWQIIRLLTGISSLFVNIFTYTCSGLVINYGSVDPFFFLVLSITFIFFKSNKDLVSQYNKLKNIIIELDNKRVSQGNPNDISSHSSSADASPSREMSQSILKHPPPHVISEKYLWFVVNRCKPIHFAVASRLMGIAVIAVLMSATFVILTEVEPFFYHSDSFAVISAAVVALIFPALKIALESHKVESHAFTARVIDAINEFAKQEKERKKKKEKKEKEKKEKEKKEEKEKEEKEKEKKEKEKKGKKRNKNKGSSHDESEDMELLPLNHNETEKDGEKHSSCQDDNDERKRQDGNGERKRQDGNDERKHQDDNDERKRQDDNDERKRQDDIDERKRQDDNDERKRQDDNDERKRQDDNGERKRQNDNDERKRQDDNEGRKRQDDNGERKSQDDNEGRESQDDIDERKSQDDNGERKSQDDNGERKSQDDNGERKSQDDNDERKRQDDNDERKLQDDIDEKKSQDEIDEKKSQNGFSFNKLFNFWG